MQEAQKGMVGINVYSFGLLPFSDSAADLKAAQRFRDFFIGWYVTPVFWFMEMFVKYFNLAYLCDYIDPFCIIHRNLVPNWKILMFRFPFVVVLHLYIS